jgi:hypothetical protein
MPREFFCPCLGAYGKNAESTELFLEETEKERMFTQQREKCRLQNTSGMLEWKKPVLGN